MRDAETLDSARTAQLAGSLSSRVVIRPAKTREQILNRGIPIGSFPLRLRNLAINLMVTVSSNGGLCPLNDRPISTTSASASGRSNRERTPVPQLAISFPSSMVNSKQRYLGAATERRKVAEPTPPYHHRQSASLELSQQLYATGIAGCADDKIRGRCLLPRDYRKPSSPPQSPVPDRNITRAFGRTRPRVAFDPIWQANNRRCVSSSSYNHAPISVGS